MGSQDLQTRRSEHVLQKRRRRRAEILHAALRAFREKGYHATTLDDIADRVGIGNTALYHYFPDKESILYDCHRESLAEVHRLLAEATSQYESAAAQLAYVIREHVRVMTETLEGSPLAFEVSALDPDHQAEVIAERDRYERGLRTIIVRGQRAGEFRSVDPKIATFAILGAINWIARWFRPDGAIHTQELGREFASQLVGGLIGR
ncbi:MAG: TetR family transcriptional regulator [Gemmatimonadetes bacterium]|nr:TetR family transcriptional regulator [Gemmatimonadota bacterium]